MLECYLPSIAAQLAGIEAFFQQHDFDSSNVRPLLLTLVPHGDATPIVHPRASQLAIGNLPFMHPPCRSGAPTHPELTAWPAEYQPERA